MSKRSESERGISEGSQRGESDRGVRKESQIGESEMGVIDGESVRIRVK